MQYNVGIAYFLWLISGCGVMGFHRFYLGKIGSGALWFFTGGLFLVGAISDFFRMPRLVDEANVRVGVQTAMAYRDLGLAGLPGVASRPKAKESPEKTILRVAQKNGGAVTPGEVALEGDLAIDEARKVLDKLASSGNAEMRVRSSGVVVYFFPEFAKEGKDDFAV